MFICVWILIELETELYFAHSAMITNRRNNQRLSDRLPRDFKRLPSDSQETFKKLPSGIQAASKRLPSDSEAIPNRFPNGLRMARSSLRPQDPVI